MISIYPTRPGNLPYHHLPSHQLTLYPPPLPLYIDIDMELFSSYMLTPPAIPVNKHGGKDMDLDVSPRRFNYRREEERAGDYTAKLSRSKFT